MTYIVAIKTKKSVTLIGDQAITFEGPGVIQRPMAPFSTFNELHVAEEERTVSQHLIKTFAIDGRVIVGFAGNVASFEDALRNLRRLIEYYSTVPLSFELVKWCILKASQDYDMITGDLAFSLAVGFVVDETPFLITYKSQTGEVVNHSEGIVQFGSMTDVLGGSYIEVTKNYVAAFLEDEIPDELVLPFISAILQSYTLHANLMEYGVGGAFIGMQINAFGIKDHPVTNYIVYYSPLAYQNYEPRPDLEDEVTFKLTNLVTIAKIEGIYMIYSLEPV